MIALDSKVKMRKILSNFFFNVVQVQFPKDLQLLNLLSNANKKPLIVIKKEQNKMKQKTIPRTHYQNGKPKRNRKINAIINID